MAVSGCSPEDFEALKAKLMQFMVNEIYPNEQTHLEQLRMVTGNEWTHPPILIELMQKAKAQGLWNMFLPVDSMHVAGDAGKLGYGLTNRQYAEICEIMGTCVPAEFASQATNCTSPDTGNMEVLARYGTEEQKKRWLVPLLEGHIRSAYAMTEPDVASSDATNISFRIDRDESTQEYVLNGKKHWITGAGSLHCEIIILLGKTNSKEKPHRQQSMVLVPMSTPGITFVRAMDTFGEIDAPKGHMELLFEDCRVPFENVLLGEGRGFEIRQGRLGPGRIHHCMRAIGQGERALSLMCKRVQQREAFGKKLAQMDTILNDIAKCRVEIETCRLLVQKAADMMDVKGNKDFQTRQMLSMMKGHVPVTIQGVVDRCIQAHGGIGLSMDTPLFACFAGARILRIADGPDDVHMYAAGRIELGIQKYNPLSSLGYFNVDRDDVFRRSTDPVSKETIARIAEFKSRL
jgi:alkylation response protein AidB-like acyl-CoA dehydrogenase